ncbi:MAG: type II secretion system secretin GspD [Kiritimatiellae bacterium]|nr:type II secretion system secretin GspD [Kiritimatiellia bacterium]
MNAFRSFGLVYAVAASAATVLAQTPAAASPEPAAAPASASVRTAESEDFLLFNFEQVDIRLFTQIVGTFTGRRFVVAEDVAGKITVVSPKVSRESAYPLFVGVLESSGFTVQREGEIDRIVRLPERKTGMGAIVADGDEKPRYGLVTRIMHLEHVNASEMRKMLEAHLQRKDSVSALDETNHLILTDTAEGVQRVEDLVKHLDKPGMARVMEVIPLEHADAVALARQIGAAYAQTQSRAEQLLTRIPGAEGPAQAVSAMSAPTIVSAEHANRLIVTGTAKQVEQIRELVRQMDISAPTGRSALNVILLSYLKAEDVAKNLTTLLEKSAVQTAAASNKRHLSIEAVPANNALLVDAAPEDFLEVERLVESLDIMPQQVHISVLIAEIAGGDAETLGVAITALNAPDSAGDTAFAGASRLHADPASGGGVLGAISEGVFGEGLTFGIAHGSHLDAAGNVVADYPAIFNLDMIRRSSKVKILSDTSLGAQNNHPAEVAIVDNIGVLESTVSGSGADRDFIQNIKRMDVGVKVNMTPYIIPGGLVKVELEPSIEAVTDSGGADQYVPTISKRMVKTTMTVPDGQTIVIAGLTRNDESEIERKVPLLGDIPLLGWLFRWNSKSATKTNILIFVTPTIMTDAADAVAVRQALEAKAGIVAETLAEELKAQAPEGDEHGNEH